MRLQYKIYYRRYPNIVNKLLITTVENYLDSSLEFVV